jgi:hypothetical protein
MTDKTAPAFPSSVTVSPAGDICDGNYYGLTKREYVAIAALQGSLSNPSIVEHFSVKHIVSESVKIADELLVLLGKTNG